MSSVLRAPEPRLHGPAAQRHEAVLPSVCFVGFSNLAVLAPEVDPSSASGEPLQHTLLATHSRVAVIACRWWSSITASLTARSGTASRPSRPMHAEQVCRPALRAPRWTGLVSALSRADAVYYSSCAGGLVGQIGMFCASRGKRFVFRTASDADCQPDALIAMGRWYRRDKWLYERGLRRASSVLVQSVRQQELMRRNFGLDSSIAGLIVEPGSSEREFGERDIDALWVSNMRSVKRPDVLLGVADQLPHFPSTWSAARCRAGNVLRNGQSAGGRSQQRDLPRRGGHSRHRRALQPRARVVNTSDIEGFPNTYLQAWSSGTPVVAFFDPDGVIAREGLGATVRTAQEMCEAVRRLTSDESEWQATRQRCLAFIERHYSEDVVLQPYLETFRRK